MINVVLCILANVGILICFREFKTHQIITLQAIVVNYFVCVLTGLIYIGNLEETMQVASFDPWVFVGIGFGFVFITSFNLIAKTTQRLGVAVAAIATKMSLIIPVLISIFILGTQSKEYSWLNYIGIFAALCAIILSSIKKRSGVKNAPTGFLALLLPMSVFLLTGFLDTSMNYINLNLITAQQQGIFPIVIFGSAFLFGSIYLVSQRQSLEWKSIVGGVFLGVINYFSIYFLLKSLSSFNNDGALVYPILNLGIILLSAGVTVMLFKERLLKLNQIGILLAIVSILMIFYQEILG